MVTQRALLDTNVISELSRKSPHPAAQAYFDTLPLEQGFISAISIGEIEKGIHLAPPQRTSELRLWLETQLLPAYQRRILPLDEAVIRRWGLFMAQPDVRSHNKIAIDALIAATASIHQLTLITRNTADFALFPIQTFNPWISQP